MPSGIVVDFDVWPCLNVLMSSKAMKTAVAVVSSDASAKHMKAIAKRDGEIADLEYQIEANAEQNTSILATAAEGALEVLGAHGAGKAAAIEGLPIGRVAWGLNALVQVAKPFTNAGGAARVSLAMPNGAALAGIGIASHQAALARRGRSEDDYKSKVDDLNSELRSSLDELSSLRKKTTESVSTPATASG